MRDYCFRVTKEGAGLTVLDDEKRCGIFVWKEKRHRRFAFSVFRLNLKAIAVAADPSEGKNLLKFVKNQFFKFGLIMFGIFLKSLRKNWRFVWEVRRILKKDFWEN